jgi:16S rRNA (guanine966-N2)-methyltransferase
MVRITGGTWRGRRLEVPRGVRPTTELARKAAFDILGDAIHGARILDACAGSGAYGLEALSRGAAHATFVEADRRVADVLRGNIERLGAGAASCIEEMSVARFSSSGEERPRRDAPRADGPPGNVPARSPSKSLAGPRPRSGAAVYDVIFHDPPFSGISESDLEVLIPLVRSGGWLIHERGDDSVLVANGLFPADVRRYGLTRLLVYRP